MSSSPHMNTNQTLPPLPGVLKEISLRGSQAAFPRARTINVLFGDQGPITFHAFHTFVAVRPLCLPGQVRAAPRGDRTAVPVSSLSSSVLRSYSQGDIVTLPTSPTSPTLSKPRPRIGNGMAPTNDLYLSLPKFIPLCLYIPIP
ncbi:hypothetical protein BKA70DRAFT_171034 [Coprinopsis sp. MPI-PUGE-AT-0042]|nr:hypothetical protein BKA70DRAFT_171034 [Coprinopsis sp. MPI-PUGE-AT-0042]